MSTLKGQEISCQLGPEQIPAGPGARFLSIMPAEYQQA
jgi:hypothetical protein